MDSTMILEEYKIYVEMADRVSERRLKTNQFYISIISGLLAIIAFVFDREDFVANKPYYDQAILIIGILGIMLNLIWLINLRSFRKLNSGKFIVIHEIEEKLPFQPYSREWDIIKKGEKKNNYFPLSQIEQFLPFLLIIPFIVLIIIN